MQITPYPLQPVDDELVADRDFVVALVFPEVGQGHLEVLIPSYEDSLRNLFEKPLQIYDGPGKTRVLSAWTGESLQYFLTSGLLSLGLIGEKNPANAQP